MSIVPLSTVCAPCFGLLCNARSSCERYAAVEQPSATAPIATCENTDHERPLYLPLRWIEQEAVPA
jgi:hypothetical protein